MKGLWLRIGGCQCAYLYGGVCTVDSVHWAVTVCARVGSFIRKWVVGWWVCVIVCCGYTVHSCMVLFAVRMSLIAVYVWEEGDMGFFGGWLCAFLYDNVCTAGSVYCDYYAWLAAYTLSVLIFVFPVYALWFLSVCYLSFLWWSGFVLLCKYCRLCAQRFNLGCTLI